MSGVSHTGACRLCRNMGDAKALRSAGCSSTYLAPDSCAARSNDTVRRTNSLDCVSSRVWAVVTSGRPIT
eukprot:2654178-Pleurochrysis_carterae.AAC.1